MAGSPLAICRIFRIQHVKRPVLQIIHEQTKKIVYTLRLTKNRVSPWVFEAGTYKVKLGDPDTDNWQGLTKQTIQ
jgi:hypothetical protein